MSREDERRLSINSGGAPHESRSGPPPSTLYPVLKSQDRVHLPPPHRPEMLMSIDVENEAHRLQSADAWTVHALLKRGSTTD